MRVTLGCVAYARPECSSCSRFLDQVPLLRGPASNTAAVTIALAHGLSPPVPLQALRAEPHALLSRAKCQSCFSRAKPAPRLLPTLLLLSGPVVSRAVGRTKPCPVPNQALPCANMEPQATLDHFWTRPATQAPSLPLPSLQASKWAVLPLFRGLLPLFPRQARSKAAPLSLSFLLMGLALACAVGQV